MAGKMKEIQAADFQKVNKYAFFILCLSVGDSHFKSDCHLLCSGFSVDLLVFYDQAVL